MAVFPTFRTNLVPTSSGQKWIQLNFKVLLWKEMFRQGGLTEFGQMRDESTALVSLKFEAVHRSEM
jgi:hypothetical protein